MNMYKKRCQERKSNQTATAKATTKQFLSKSLPSTRVVRMLRMTRMARTLNYPLLLKINEKEKEATPAPPEEQLHS